jgi:hypothetical protein
MKRTFTIFLLLIGSMQISLAKDEPRIDPLRREPLKITPAKPPEPIHLVQILLENQSIPLKGTRCESSPPVDNRRLHHQLALTLGFAAGNKRHRSEISASCKSDQIETLQDPAEVWLCKLGVVERDKKGRFVASSHIHFGVTKDTWQMVPNSLVCLE